MRSRILFLYVFLFLMYYLQVSFPYFFSIGTISLNFILFLVVAVFYLFPLRLLWPILFIAALLLENTTDLPFGVISVVVISIVLLLKYLKSKISDDYLALAIIPICLVAYSALVSISALFAGYFDWSSVWQYSYKIAPIEIVLGIVLTAIFYLLISKYIKAPPSKIQIEN